MCLEYVEDAAAAAEQGFAIMESKSESRIMAVDDDSFPTNKFEKAVDFSECEVIIHGTRNPPSWLKDSIHNNLSWMCLL